jgi:hypothetical protein
MNRYERAARDPLNDHAPEPIRDRDWDEFEPDDDEARALRALGRKRLEDIVTRVELALALKLEEHFTYAALGEGATAFLRDASRTIVAAIQDELLP